MKRENVKRTALKMVKKSGLINLSRRELCEQADIPDGSFPHIMGCTFSEFINELRKETEDTKNHTVTKSRVDPKDRKQQILSVAVKMACNHGYDKITRDDIAGNAGVSMGLVTKYFGSMIKLRRAIIRAAIKQEIPEIIAQGLANGDTHARKAPAELKAKAAQALV